MNEISAIELFVRVVDKGSFSAAARFMGVTPSSVSRTIAQLEKELGGRLFQRTTRTQNLTETGQIYYQYALRIVDDLEASRLAVHRLTDTPSGTLQITAEADFALAFIQPILSEFLQQYPEVNIRLHMSAGIEHLVEGGVDLAIRIGHLNDSSLIAKKIAQSRSLVCASPDYLKQHGIPQHPEDLQSHNCLSFHSTPGRNYWKFMTSRGPIDVPISGSLNVNGLAFLRNAALNGLGIIIIPTWMIQEALKQERLVPILQTYPSIPSSTPVHAVFANNRQLAPKVRAFVDFLAQRMEVF